MIYIQYTHNKKVARFKTGEYVNPKFFKNGEITKGYGKDYKSTNSNIENLKSKIDNIIRKANFSDVCRDYYILSGDQQIKQQLHQQNSRRHQKKEF